MLYHNRNCGHSSKTVEKNLNKGLLISGTFRKLVSTGSVILSKALEFGFNIQIRLTPFKIFTNNSTFQPENFSEFSNFRRECKNMNELELYSLGFMITTYYTCILANFIILYTVIFDLLFKFHTH